MMFPRRSTLAGLVSLCAVAAALTGLPAPAAAEECPNAVFRTGPSAHLPDCRAYEMVTPPFKNTGSPEPYGYSPEGTSGLIGIGGAVAGLESTTGAVVGFLPGGFYSTRRTASGWTIVPDDPPASEYVPYLQSGFSEIAGESLDGQTTAWLDRGVWQSGNGVDFFERRPDRSIVDVGPALPPTTPPGTPQELGQKRAELYARGVSADGSHIFFDLYGDFWPFDNTEEKEGFFGDGGHPSLYEYVGTGNTTPLLVGVDDEGKQIGHCGVALGGRIPGNSHNAVSMDGSIVFFTVLSKNNEYEQGCKASAPPVAELFARIDNGLADARTVAISEPTREDCALCDTEAGVLGNATFEGASESGGKAFFSTLQPLLGGAGGLYEYDLGAPVGERVRLVGAGGSAIAVSEDGSRVYFRSSEVLSAAANYEGQHARLGADNVYVYNTETGQTTFITDGEVGGLSVTPDGRFAVFGSSSDLTPDDTSTAAQVFEYDAQTNTMVRVSIGQDGFNHNGNVAIKFSIFGFPLNDAGIVGPQYQLNVYDAASYSSGLSVSADGSYVFFQSIVGLTPQALNEQVIGERLTEGCCGIHGLVQTYANNIYEYHDGRVSLISDGRDIIHGEGATPQSLVVLRGTDLSGADVLFETSDQLVAQDTNENVDIYDARVDGGFPAPVVSSCEGEACQGPLSGAPTLLSPGSEFQAGGNPPLSGEPAASSSKPKAKGAKKRAKRHAAGRHARRRGRKASVAAAPGRADRKVGRR